MPVPAIAGEPKACAASSTIGRPNAASSSSGAGRPNRCTGMIAFVRAVSLPLDVGRVEVQRPGSMSAKTGVAPTRAIASAVAKNVNAGQITSSPGADLERVEDEHDRVGAVRDADRLGHAEVLGRLLLERLDVRPEDELAVLEHLGEGLLELRDERRVLRLDVNERNRRHASLSRLRSGPAAA